MLRFAQKVMFANPSFTIEWRWDGGQSLKKIVRY